MKNTNIAAPLKSLAVPIDTLRPDPANARKHGEKNLDAIKSSLAAFGQRKPIVVQREGMIVRAGNGTLEAAKALGWTHIAAVVLDDDNSTAVQFAIADNRTAELAEWDEETLSALIEPMDEATRAALGFTEEDVAKLLDSLTPQEPTGTGESKLGDIAYSVQVMVDGEEQQARLIERLEKEGFTCKALMS